jgi:hypothetical protein
MGNAQCRHLQCRRHQVVQQGAGEPWSFGVLLQRLAQGVTETLCGTAQDLAFSYHESSTMQDF